MKKVILMAVMAIAFTACQGEPNLDTIPELNPYAAEYEEGPSLDFDGILNMVYSPEENIYLIEYVDSDVFDLTDAECDYLTLIVRKEIFFEILNDFEKSHKERVDMWIDGKYILHHTDLSPYPYEVIKSKGGRHE